ncbi:MAG TPA: response regulator [Thermoanaerobaculia bacterium]|nr:response regulator [Thermoanaerobaculia bacterium]
MLPPTERSSPKILIVDDQPTNVRLLELTLRRAGYTEVMSTTEPCEVSPLHLEHRYDLILLDLQMPRMNGLQVMTRLQEIRASRPVLVLVLSADPSRRLAATAAGADSFLAKPFRLPEIVERVELLLKTGRHSGLQCARPGSFRAATRAEDPAD